MDLRQEIINVFNNHSFEETRKILYEKYDVDRYDSNIQQYIKEAYNWKEDNGLINFSVYEFGIDRVKYAIDELVKNIERRKNNIIVVGKDSNDVLKQIFKMTTKEQQEEALVRQFGMTIEQAKYYIDKFKNYNDLTFDKDHTLGYSSDEYDLETVSIEGKIGELASELDRKNSINDLTKREEATAASINKTQNSFGITQNTQTETNKVEVKSSPQQTREQHIKSQLRNFFINIPYKIQASSLCEAFDMPLDVAVSIVDSFGRIGTPPEKSHDKPSSEYERQQNWRYKNFNYQLDVAYKIIEKYAKSYNNELESESKKM